MASKTIEDLKAARIAWRAEGVIYSVRVWDIVTDRAAYYKGEYGGDLEQSILQDTAPLFLSNEYEIADWAQNNMDAEDFSDARMTPTNPPSLSDVMSNGDFVLNWKVQP